MSPSDLNPFLESLAAEEGFVLSGSTRLERPLSFEIYRQWIQDGLHGKMEYLEKHLPWKETPSSRYPFARSAFCFAIPYRPHPVPVTTPLKQSRIASYARGGDYHFWLKEKLSRIVLKLREKWPEADFEVHTDSSPLLERDLAVRAGLGWVGKNTCVLDRKEGSFFLLGEILTSLDFEAMTPATNPDFCGRCTRCLDACPTGALVEPRKLDARRCISYLSIESREVPPENLREAWGDWLFGCDICQSVCPWNQKPFQPSENEKRSTQELSEAEVQALEAELRWLLTASGKSLEKSFRGSALSRAGNFGLKRNALVVAGNRRLKNLRPEIEKWRDDARLGELAQWSLARLGDNTL